MADSLVKVAFQLVADGSQARQAVQSLTNTIQSSFSSVRSAFSSVTAEQQKSTNATTRALAEQEKAASSASKTANAIATIGQETQKNQVSIERYNGLLKSFETSLRSAAAGNTTLGDTFRKFGIDVTQALKEPEVALKNFAQKFADFRLSKAPAREITGAARSLFGGGDITRTIGDLDSLGRNLQQFEATAGRTATTGTQAAEAITGIGSASGGAASGIGAAGLALGAFVAIVVVAVAAIVKLGVETFNLSRQAAEAGARYQDLNDKTGVSIRNLALFGTASSEVGKGFEIAERSLDQFVSRLDDARRSSGETREAFRRVGIDPTEAFKDVNKAFETAVKNLNSYKNTTERSADAQRIFGLRNEAIIPILSRVGGSLDDYAKRTGNLTIFTEQNAQAAKSFSVSLNSLQVVAGQAGQVIGVGFLPLFQPLIDLMITLNRTAVRGLIVVMQRLSPTLQDVGVGIDVVNAALRSSPAFFNVARAAAADLLTVFARISIAGGSVGKTLGALVAGNFQAAITFGSQAVDQIGKVTEGIGENTRRAITEAKTETAKAFLEIQRDRRRLGREDRTREPENVAKATKEADDEAKARLKALELAEREARRIFQDTTDEIKRQYDQRRISSQQFTDQSIAALNRLLEAERATLAEERRVVEQSKLKSTEKETRLAEIGLKEREATSRFNREQARLQDEETKRRIESARQQERTLAEIQQVSDRAAIERIRDLADRRIITTAEAERRVAAIEQQAFDRRRQLLNAEFLAAGQNLQEQQKVNGEIAKLEADRAAATEDATRRISDALSREAAERLRLRQEIAEQEREARQQATETARARTERRLGVEQDPREIQRLQQQRADLLITEADIRNEANRIRLLAEEDALTSQAQSEEERLRIQETFNRRFEEEERRHNEELSLIRQDAELQSAAADPTSNQSLFGVNDEQVNRLTAFGSAASLALNQVSASAGNMQTILSSALSSVSSGLQTMLTNMILTGQTGPAAFKKLAAGAIAGIAAQSLVKAIFETAEGFAALARFDGAAAALHFKAAGIYALVGAAAGGIAAAIGGGGGAGAGAGGGAGSQSANQFQPPQRDLRASEGSPFRGDGFDELRQAVGARVDEGDTGPFGIFKRLDETLNKFAAKFEPASPGDVLMAGASQRPDVIASAVVDEQVRDAGFIRELATNLGVQ